MLSIEKILSITKSDLPEASKVLKKDDIPQLIDWLSLKDNSVRYQVFLLLQNRSLYFNDIYPYWDTFRNKLKSDNSYQRSIGLILVAENAKWDTESRMEDTIDEYLTLLNDEKPITIRQCIQALGKVALAKPCLNDKIVSGLISVDIMTIKETMRRSVLLDILNVLLVIHKGHRFEEIENYITYALASDILDKKSKKQIEILL